MPPTLRSPIVIRKDLSAIVASVSSRSSDSPIVACAVDSGTSSFGRVAAMRRMRGVLPNNTSIGMSTGTPPSSESVTVSRPSPVISPTTA